VESIRVSQRGEVKIGKSSTFEESYKTDCIRSDPTIDPAGSAQTLADLNSLGTVMFESMREDRETLKLPGRADRSAEALNFLQATSSASPDELSDVSTDGTPTNHC
jgi:hypothetical protein